MKTIWQMIAWLEHLAPRQREEVLHLLKTKNVDQLRADYEECPHPVMRQFFEHVILLRRIREALYPELKENGSVRGSTL